MSYNSLTNVIFTYKNIQGALLGTRFESFDELKVQVKIYYFDDDIKTVNLKRFNEGAVSLKE